MQRDIGDKIDFFMKVTGTSNAQLARALNFDASYISRIRAGKRGLPPELPFIEPAADFFARNIRENYQAETIARELGLSSAWPTDKQKATWIIAKWLEGTFGDIGGLEQEQASSSEGMPNASAVRQGTAGKLAEARLFFGDEGRREASLAFLSYVADAGEPCELLLQSDEDIAWMYQDASFVSKWSSRMAQLAESGCTFSVVHTVARGGNEMWEGLRAWLPLYYSGAIRP